jgi:hypothetical protein
MMQILSSYVAENTISALHFYELAASLGSVAAACLGGQLSEVFGGKVDC